MRKGREVAFLTKSLKLAVQFPHSVAAKSVYYTLFVAITERVFFMKKIFGFPKFTANNLCAIAMLMAITTILAVFCTFRIGDLVKIPFKFISVFIAGVFFGPWVGGLCGAVGDILNVLLVPSGAPIPALTVLEFLIGFIYGALFYRPNEKRKIYFIKCLICAVLMFLIDMFLSTAVLLSVGYFPNFKSAFFLRLPAGVIKAGVQLIFFLFGYGYIEKLRKIIPLSQKKGL